MMEVLLVDDDPVDVKSVVRAFDQLGSDVNLSVAPNGEEALRHLRRKGGMPGLILLDLNMPVMNGFEFLEAYKADEALRHIPSVVFTTSNEPRDRRDTYRHGIAGYIVKPIDFNEFRETLRKVDRYWSTCELP